MHNKSIKNIKYQTSVDTSELADYLTALAEAVENGALIVKNQDGFLALHPRGLVDLTVKVRQKKNRRVVSLDMSWSEDETTDDL